MLFSDGLYISTQSSYSPALSWITLSLFAQNSFITRSLAVTTGEPTKTDSRVDTKHYPGCFPSQKF